MPNTFGGTPWTYEETAPRRTKQDSFAKEFFTGEGESKEAHGRTDALIREVLQNSLDARDENQSGPVRVRFGFSPKDQELNKECALVYLDGLVPHLHAVGNRYVNETDGVSDMRYLVVEDFGTRGLTGDPARIKDPLPEESQAESFYWFWRNVGRSGKDGKNRGRWGLGKTVFPSASKINAFFGLTVRSTDGQRLLMGQAITKVHQIGNVEYAYEGFFHNPKSSQMIQMPFDQSNVLEQFIADFSLKRRDEPGLSIVIPYVRDLYAAPDVVRSAILHFFVPILKGDLVVEVSDAETVVLNQATIRTVATTVSWSGSVQEKKHTPPPFDFVEWAIAQQASKSLPQLNLAGTSTAPQWGGEGHFPAELLNTLKAKFLSGERFGVRVPLTIEKLNRSLVNAYFDVFIEQDSDVSRGEDYFVREGMTISKITTIPGERGIRGLVLVDDAALSALLGDAEGPAHTTWGESEDRPEESYIRWIPRVRFTKNSIKKLLDILRPPPEGLDADLLRDIFSIDDPSKLGTGKKRRKKKTGPVGPPTPPEPPKTPKLPVFEIEELDGKRGFRVKAGPGLETVPIKIHLDAAYLMPSGNSMRHYERWDFIFDEGNSAPLKFAQRGINFEIRNDNQLEFTVNDKDFCLEVTGFDEKRDLDIDAYQVKE